MFVRGIIVEVTVTDGVAGAWNRGLRLDSANGCGADHLPRAWGVPSKPLFRTPNPLKTALGAPQRRRVEDVEALLTRLELCRTELL